MEVHPHKFDTAEAAVRFMLAGNATVTLKSRTTGGRFTYRVRKSPDDAALFFVNLMNGPDNEGSYTYLGCIRVSNAGPIYWHGRRSKVSSTAPSAAGFKWTWERLVKGRMPEQLEVWHEARCGRCHRKLTVPESIKTGMGPECSGRGIMAGMKNFFSEEV
jgi:hypothetical protein